MRTGRVAGSGDGERVGGASPRHRRYSPTVESLEGRRLLSAFGEFPLAVANSNPGDLTLGPDGNFWFPYGNNSFEAEVSPGIGRITPAGVVTTFPTPGVGATEARPGDVTVGPDGNLWFAGGGWIGRITPAGAITVFPLPIADVAGSDKVTAGPDGNLWTDASGVVARITPAGVVTVIPVPSNNVGLLNLTVGPDGNLWLPEDGQDGAPGVIVRITPAGTTTVLRSPTPEASRAT